MDSKKDKKDKPKVTKMTPEQKELFDALTTLQKEIALNSFSGMSDIDSYKASSGKASTVKAMESSVSQILGNHKVKAFLDSMNEVAVSDAVMSRERMMELQTQIININADRIPQMTLTELTELKGGLDVQLKAMKQLSELAGYDAPKQIEVAAKEELTPWGAIEIGVDE